MSDDSTSIHAIMATGGQIRRILDWIEETNKALTYGTDGFAEDPNNIPPALPSPPSPLSLSSLSLPSLSIPSLSEDSADSPLSSTTPEERFGGFRTQQFSNIHEPRTILEHSIFRLYERLVHFTSNIQRKPATSMKLGCERERDLLASIVRETRQSRRLQRDKQGWSDGVYEPVLDVALFGYDDVTWESTASAKVSILFSPKGHVAPQPVEDAGADYVLCLEPDKSTEERIFSAVTESMVRHETYPSINHCTHRKLRLRPIGISIIVADPIDKETEIATGKVTLWTAALIERVRMLRLGDCLSSLPAIVISGPLWYLIFVENSPQKPDVWLHRSSFLGHTRDFKSATELIQCLRILVDWVSLEFAEWWDTYLSDEITWEFACSGLPLQDEEVFWTATGMNGNRVILSSTFPP